MRILEVKPSVLFGTDLYGPAEEHVCCPVCGFGYTHPIGAGTRVGSDDWEAGIYCWTRPLGVTDDRRSALVVWFYCESGHRFALVIQQHKGVNLVSLEAGANDPSYSESPGEPPSDVMSDFWRAQRKEGKARMLQHEAARLRNKIRTGGDNP